MRGDLLEHLQKELSELEKGGLFKPEQVIASAQDGELRLPSGKRVINLCANNYLGLANHPDLIAAACDGMRKWGFGMASVRFICGTQTIHKQLERAIADFVGMEDAILYGSCFDANGGLFETLLGPDDAVISDELNHASIIDGIRLCKARRLRYKNGDMAQLEERLKEASGCHQRLIATDGVFSMDGQMANLPAICDLADQYGALVMVDDCHATGFVGKEGRGSHEFFDVMDRIDILTGTFGKALGGASGGYTAARRPIVEWLRQRSRPYLFSNAPPPATVCASLRALEMIEGSSEIRERLEENSRFFRHQMEEVGFELAGSGHPIIPVMLYDAQLAADFAQQLLERGVYAVAFSYPVVPQEEARIRTQMSALHTHDQLRRAVEVFAEVGQSLGVIR